MPDPDELRRVDFRCSAGDFGAMFRHFAARDAFFQSASEVGVRRELMFASGGPEEKARLVRSIFEALWPVGDASPFGALLKRIDEAVLVRRCRARLERFNRILRRDSAR